MTMTPKPDLTHCDNCQDIIFTITKKKTSIEARCLKCGNTQEIAEWEKI